MYEAAFDELDGTHGGLMMWKHFYFYFYFGGGRSANIVHALFTCLIEKDLTWSPFFLIGHLYLSGMAILVVAKSGHQIDMWYKS